MKCYFKSECHEKTDQNSDVWYFHYDQGMQAYQEGPLVACDEERCEYPSLKVTTFGGETQERQIFKHDTIYLFGILFCPNFSHIINQQAFEIIFLN